MNKLKEAFEFFYDHFVLDAPCEVEIVRNEYEDHPYMFRFEQGEYIFEISIFVGQNEPGELSYALEVLDKQRTSCIVSVSNGDNKQEFLHRCATIVKLCTDENTQIMF